MGKLLGTIASVLIAVGVFAGLWVGANLMFSQVSVNFKRFSALIGAVIGFVVFAVIDGNNLITGIATRPATFELGSLHVYLFWPIVGAALFAAAGVALASFDDRKMRLAIGIGAGVLVGVILAITLKTRYELAMRTNPLIIWTVAVTAVGAGLSVLRKRNPVTGALSGAFVGWLLGSFGGALQGVSASNQLETTLAFVVAGALLGARLGLTDNPDIVGKANIDNRSRSWLFVGPAFLFIAVMLIIPTVQTLILSVQGDKPVEAGSSDYDFVGLDNYQNILSNPQNIDSSNFGAFWGSDILPWAVFFVVAGVLIAFLLGRETKQGLNFIGAPLLPLVIGFALLSFALFTHLRGTIINNIWWVIAVTLLSTSLGLAIAKLADGAKFEPVAKSFVFMPMAISFVGASIIWRLMMYQARDASKAQTGLLNAIWVWLGKVTTTQPGQVIIGAIFALAAVALVFAAVRGVAKSPAVAGLYLSLAAIPAWVAYRTFAEGIGGYIPAVEGEAVRPLPVNFVQGVPFNNFWLMVILIWVQTGFAMVILSAAIKAVPEDFVEAAKIDGATDGQIFWRITVPQILPTIGVVATTIMVNVMKVFDIVKVTTNGQFGTQVLANAMFQEAFQFTNRGTGAALAMVLFLGILPIMVYNIYNLTKEG